MTTSNFQGFNPRHNLLAKTGATMLKLVSWTTCKRAQPKCEAKRERFYLAVAICVGIIRLIFKRNIMKENMPTKNGHSKGSEKRELRIF